MSQSEHLREALLDLERARLREQQRRVESTSLHAGMTALTRNADSAIVFAELFHAFRAALDFVDAFVLVAQGDGTLRAVAATSQPFEHVEFRPGALFERVLQGAPAAVFDVQRISEWRQSGQGGARWRELGVLSALHVQTSSRARAALLVFTHEEHGAFGPREVRLARRFAPLVSQALLKSGPDRWAHYEVQEKIGTGGMGEVYLARQRMPGGLTRTVILKTILPELARHMPFVHQFLDEARVASTLNHPNIVSIYEVGQASGGGDAGWFIAMEYIQGVDLMQLMSAHAHLRRPLPVSAIHLLMRDAARGLHHAHTARDAGGSPLGIVHRDVSPQNLMVRLDGLTKVLDFGIAKSANRLETTTPGSFRGKLSYMSPEQASGDELDARSDQYSLGIVAWELCTGQRLFQTDSPVKTMRRLLSGAIPKPRSIRPDLPEALEAIVLRMLRQRPADRFEDLAEVASAFDAQIGPENRKFDLGGLVHECVSVLTALTTASMTGPPLDEAAGEVTLVTAPPAWHEENEE
jgi:serine/threonine protein kinase